MEARIGTHRRMESVSGKHGSNRQCNTLEPDRANGMARAFYSSRVDLLEHCLGELEPAIAPYILRGVTEGHSYEALRIKGCPCCKDTYYNNYRKFFWILSRERA